MSEFEIKIKTDDKELAVHYLNGPKYNHVFQEIQDNVFRPARKHGYFQATMTELLKDNDVGLEIIGELETLFLEVLENNGVSI